MKFVVKNLLENQAVTLLKELLTQLQISLEKEPGLGEVFLTEPVSRDKLRQLRIQLESNGLPILTDRREQLSEQVRHIVAEMLATDEPLQENYSNYISRRLHLNYTYLANIFSTTQGSTIEHLIINAKIEKAKAILSEGRYTIGQVAEKLHYSSIGHFSNQFKKVTGKNPSVFKKSVL